MDEQRCPWCGDEALYVAYHDTEWGVPEVDSRALFEKLILEGFQAGLAWITILRKRDGFRAAFDGFDPAAIARYGKTDIDRLVGDAAIVRHRGKIEATIGNAKAFLAIEERGGFSDYLWRYVEGVPIRNRFAAMADVPAQTALSQRLSKDLKKDGFTFCGPTTVYAFMQAAGLVNDHLTGCFREPEVAALAP